MPCGTNRCVPSTYFEVTGMYTSHSDSGSDYVKEVFEADLGNVVQSDVERNLVALTSPNTMYRLVHMSEHCGCLVCMTVFRLSISIATPAGQSTAYSIKSIFCLQNHQPMQTS